MLISGLKDKNDSLLAHYTNMQSLIGIIENSEIWATNILYTNDSSEYFGALEFIRRQINKADFSPNLALSKNLLSSIIDMKSKAPLNPSVIYSISFSENPSLMSQWRAYAKPSGVSLIFSKSRIEKMAAEQGFKIVKCIYDDEAKINSLSAMLDDLNIECALTPYADQIAGLVGGVGGKPPALKELFFNAKKKFDALASTFKDSTFSEEAEWRVVSDPLSPTKTETPHFRVVGDIMIPFLKFSLRNDINAIHQVAIGPSSNEVLNASAVCTLLQANNYLAHVSWSNIPLRAF